MPYHDPRQTEADRLSDLAAHNLRESYAIAEKREKRLDFLRARAEKQVQQRPTVSIKPVNVLDDLARNDARLDEYGAGLQITERRATMYAAMATDLRLAILVDRLTASD